MLSSFLLTSSQNVTVINSLISIEERHTVRNLYSKGKVRESESEWVNTLILMCECVSLCIISLWTLGCVLLGYGVCCVLWFIFRYLVILAILENLGNLAFLEINLSFLS